MCVCAHARGRGENGWMITRSVYNLIWPNVNPLIKLVVKRYNCGSSYLAERRMYKQETFMNGTPSLFPCLFRHLNTQQFLVAIAFRLKINL